MAHLEPLYPPYGPNIGLAVSTCLNMQSIHAEPKLLPQKVSCLRCLLITMRKFSIEWNVTSVRNSRFVHRQEEAALLRSSDSGLQTLALKGPLKVDLLSTFIHVWHLTTGGTNQLEYILQFKFNCPDLLALANMTEWHVNSFKKKKEKKRTWINLRFCRW